MRGRREFETTQWLRAHAPEPVDTSRLVLTSGDVWASPVRGRLVVVWADPSRHRALGRSLATLGLLDPATGLLGTGLLRIWTDYQWVTHMGPAVMAEPRDFLVALRRLSDTLLGAAAPGSGPFAELVAPTPLARALVSSLYPDAQQVELDRGLPAVVAALSVQPGPPFAAPGPHPAPATGAAAPEVLFILASARSGTTWLASSLQTHPDVGGIGEAESWIFEMLEPLWRVAEDPGALGAHVPLDVSTRAVRRFCDTLFASALERHAPGARLFVEKTPGHIRHLPALAAVYPDARYVHLVRDGREVARSLSGMAMAGHPHLGQAATSWRESVRTVRAQGALLSRLLEVRYEALAADPVPGVASVLEWAGFPVDAATRAALTAHVGRRVSALSNPPGTVGATSWQSMSPWALARVYAGAADMLAAEGYLDRREWQALRRHPRYMAARVLQVSRSPAGVVRSRMSGRPWRPPRARRWRSPATE